MSMQTFAVALQLRDTQLLIRTALDMMEPQERDSDTYSTSTSAGSGSSASELASTAAPEMVPEPQPQPGPRQPNSTERLMTPAMSFRWYMNDVLQGNLYLLMEPQRCCWENLVCNENYGRKTPWHGSWELRGGFYDAYFDYKGRNALAGRKWAVFSEDEMGFDYRNRQIRIERRSSYLINTRTGSFTEDV